MTLRPRVLCLVLVPLLLSGCTATAAPSPAPTVTVTATPAVASPEPGDSTSWDLHAVCAAESEAQTLIVWRDQQSKAGRLTPVQSAAVLQAVAVVYLEFDSRGVAAPVQKDISTLRDAAGTLEHPRIDLGAKAVRTARNDLQQACQASGITIGIVAQGG